MSAHVIGIAHLQEVQAMLSEREQLAADKEAEAQGLQRHLAQLLGMPQADVPMLHRARFGAHGSSGSGADQAAASRIAALEVCGAWQAGKATHARVMPVGNWPACIRLSILILLFAVASAALIVCAGCQRATGAGPCGVHSQRGSSSRRGGCRALSWGQRGGCCRGGDCQAGGGLREAAGGGGAG